MTDADDENELSFTHIAALTANVVGYLGLDKKQQETAEDSSPGGKDDKRTKEHGEYVARRLREIAAWERKLNRR